MVSLLIFISEKIALLERLLKSIDPLLTIGYFENIA